MTIATQINDVLRYVRFDDAENIITLSQTFPTSADDLWEACTTPERLARWFEAVEGDLRLGGRYRMADSGTVGTIEACDAPRTLVVTWEHGDDTSRVEARIKPAGDGRAALTISHAGEHNEYWRQYGPAAGGSGWDAALLGLAMTFDDPTTTLDDINTTLASPEGRRFVEDVIAAWARAHEDAGAESDEARATAGRALELERELWSGS